jgi:thiol:disulfide interchange protein
MKRALVGLLAILPMTLLAAQSRWFQGSLEQAEAAAKAQNKMVVLKFYADW